MKIIDTNTDPDGYSYWNLALDAGKENILGDVFDDYAARQSNPDEYRMVDALTMYTNGNSPGRAAKNSKRAERINDSNFKSFCKNFEFGRMTDVEIEYLQYLVNKQTQYAALGEIDGDANTLTTISNADRNDRAARLYAAMNWAPIEEQFAFSKAKTISDYDNVTKSRHKMLLPYRFEDIVSSKTEKTKLAWNEINLGFVAWPKWEKTIYTPIDAGFGSGEEGYGKDYRHTGFSTPVILNIFSTPSYGDINQDASNVASLSESDIEDIGTLEKIWNTIIGWFADPPVSAGSGLYEKYKNFEKFNGFSHRPCFKLNWNKDMWKLGYFWDPTANNGTGGKKNIDSPFTYINGKLSIGDLDKIILAKIKGWKYVNPVMDNFFQKTQTTAPTGLSSLFEDIGGYYGSQFSSKFGGYVYDATSKYFILPDPIGSGPLTTIFSPFEISDEELIYLIRKKYGIAHRHDDDYVEPPNASPVKDKFVSVNGKRSGVIFEGMRNIQYYLIPFVDDDIGWYPAQSIGSRSAGHESADADDQFYERMMGQLISENPEDSFWNVIYKPGTEGIRVSTVQSALFPRTSIIPRLMSSFMGHVTYLPNWERVTFNESQKKGYRPEEDITPLVGWWSYHQIIKHSTIRAYWRARKILKRVDSWGSYIEKGLNTGEVLQLAYTDKTVIVDGGEKKEVEMVKTAFVSGVSAPTEKKPKPENWKWWSTFQRAYYSDFEQRPWEWLWDYTNADYSEYTADRTTFSDVRCEDITQYLRPIIEPGIDIWLSPILYRYESIKNTLAAVDRTAMFHGIFARNCFKSGGLSAQGLIELRGWINSANPKLKEKYKSTFSVYVDKSKDVATGVILASMSLMSLKYWAAISKLEKLKKAKDLAKKTTEVTDVSIKTRRTLTTEEILQLGDEFGNIEDAISSMDHVTHAWHVRFARLEEAATAYKTVGSITKGDYIQMAIDATVFVLGYYLLPKLGKKVPGFKKYAMPITLILAGSSYIYSKYNKQLKLMEQREYFFSSLQKASALGVLEGPYIQTNGKVKIKKGEGGKIPIGVKFDANGNIVGNEYAEFKSGESSNSAERNQGMLNEKNKKFLEMAGKETDKFFKKLQKEECEVLLAIAGDLRNNNRYNPILNSAPNGWNRGFFRNRKPINSGNNFLTDIVKNTYDSMFASFDEWDPNDIESDLILNRVMAPSIILGGHSNVEKSSATRFRIRRDNGALIPGWSEYTSNYCSSYYTILEGGGQEGNNYKSGELIPEDDKQEIKEIRNTISPSIKSDGTYDVEADRPPDNADISWWSQDTKKYRWWIYNNFYFLYTRANIQSSTDLKDYFLGIKTPTEKYMVSYSAHYMNWTSPKAWPILAWGGYHDDPLARLGRYLGMSSYKNPMLDSISVVKSKPSGYVVGNVIREITAGPDAPNIGLEGDTFQRMHNLMISDKEKVWLIRKKYGLDKIKGKGLGQQEVCCSTYTIAVVDTPPDPGYEDEAVLDSLYKLVPDTNWRMYSNAQEWSWNEGSQTVTVESLLPTDLTCEYEIDFASSEFIKKLKEFCAKKNDSEEEEKQIEKERDEINKRMSHGWRREFENKMQELQIEVDKDKNPCETQPCPDVEQPVDTGPVIPLQYASLPGISNQDRKDPTIDINRTISLLANIYGMARPLFSPLRDGYVTVGDSLAEPPRFYRRYNPVTGETLEYWQQSLDGNFWFRTSWGGK